MLAIGKASRGVGKPSKAIHTWSDAHDVDKRGRFRPQISNGW
jgi:hypothetical protein